MARPQNPGARQSTPWNQWANQAAMMPYVYPQSYNPMYFNMAPIPRQPSLKRPAPPPTDTDATQTKDIAGSKDHHVLWTKTYDKPIPEEVLQKCKPLYCELCSVNLNSVIQAKMHYEGKGHDKKVRFALQAWAKQNNCIPPTKAKLSQDGPTPAQVPRIDYGAYEMIQSLYCAPCDTSFTSQAHAHQHFSGRNHQRVISGLAPLKTGYFNTRTGKWQRQPLGENETTEKTAAAVVMEGYQAPTPVMQPPLPPLHGLKPPPPPPPPSEEVAVPGNGSLGGPMAKYFCSICNVNATSQSQLDLHLNGRNHKLRSSKLKITDPYGGIQIIPPHPALPVKIQQDVKPPKPKKDLSIYRTPSGQFYCAQCNCCVNSENQFVQHCASKKHKLKESSSKSKSKSPGKSKK